MLIKPGFEEKWKEYVEINSKEDYSKACITCTIKFCEYFEEGKTFDQAEKLLLRTKLGKELTAMMVVMIIRGIIKYHPRGEEVKEWWNKKHGITDKTIKEMGAKIASVTSKHADE